MARINFVKACMYEKLYKPKKTASKTQNIVLRQNGSLGRKVYPCENEKYILMKNFNGWRAKVIEVLKVPEQFLSAKHSEIALISVHAFSFSSSGN